jgi:hypothetical protein
VSIIFAFITATPYSSITSPFANSTLRQEGGAGNGKLPAAVNDFHRNKLANRRARVFDSYSFWP